MMRNPGEARSVEVKMPQCPKCGERYCGDGVALCVECAILTPNAEFTGPRVGQGDTE